MRVAKPQSRKNIRKIAHMIREICNSSDDFFFDILGFVELLLPRLYDDFQLVICTESEMGKNEGLTYPEKGIMKIREDVYIGACEGNGRDRFTIAHELGHFLLHQNNSISFARNNHGKIAPYEDPEWQADAFAGELLIPARLVSGMSYQDISRECGVSYKAAMYQLKKI